MRVSKLSRLVRVEGEDEGGDEGEDEGNGEGEDEGEGRDGGVGAVAVAVAVAVAGGKGVGELTEVELAANAFALRRASGRLCPVEPQDDHRV